MSERPTVKMERSPDELVERFGRLLEAFPEATRRKMFGYPAAFVGGNLATSLYGPGWVVRLAVSDQSALLAVGGQPFEPMPGRPMKGYLLLPASVLEDDDATSRWVGLAIAHTATLPPKPTGR
jgi:TfoX/Sxy family transcriptional regulator of competence genes